MATILASTALMMTTTSTTSTRSLSLKMKMETTRTTATSITTKTILTMMMTMRTHILAVTSRASKPHPMSNLELSYGLFAILTTQLAKSASNTELEARSTLLP
jgi:hypothetical protein